jgi:hypothetical protein
MTLTLAERQPKALWVCDFVIAQTFWRTAMPDMFLTKEELVTLTARKIKRLQIEQLRKMNIPFWVNAVGGPVVARAAIEGRSGAKTVEPKAKWRSNAMKD